MINEQRARFIAVILGGENSGKKREANNEELRSNFRVGPQDKPDFSILKERKMKELQMGEIRQEFGF